MVEHVFVYGSLKRGFSNSRLMKGADFVGRALTTDATYRRGNVGLYPEVTRDYSESAGFIAGELFQCDQQLLQLLDQLESNGAAYQREPISLQLLDGRPATESIRAWCYLWIRPPCPDVKPNRHENSVPVYEWVET